MNWIQIIILIVALIGIFFLNKFFHKFIKEFGVKKQLKNRRIVYVQKFITFLSIVAIIIAASLIFSIDYKGLFVFVSSVLAVIGVALFAQWSILSNVTASVVIFFSFPTRIGDKVKVVDGENSIEGEIVEISLFHVELRDKDGNTVMYPNNLLIQKPLVKILHP